LWPAFLLAYRTKKKRKAMQRMEWLCGLAVVFCCAGVAGAEESVKEGKWEFTSEMQVEGMPKMPELPAGMKLPDGMAVSSKGNTMRTTVTKCVTNQDMVPADEKDKNCKVTKMERRGNTVNWSVVCTDKEGKTTGDGTATYSGNTMRSKMVMNTQSGGYSGKQEVKTTGRYLGPCTK
jgi:hypothetical protein